MSRIEDILAKAARDGQVRRTGNLAEAGDRGRPEVRTAPVVVAKPPVRPTVLSAAQVARPPAPVTPQAPVPSAVLNPVLTPAQSVRAPRLHPLLVAARSPHSSVAEQYRAIRTRITQSETGRHCRTILVTSPLGNDGKTLTALNLAVTMAQEFHRRVVAVDADLRHGALHRLFAISDRPGLSDVLQGAVPLESALVSVPDLRLTLLPAGSPAAQPAELLGSAEMRRVLDTLQTQFDRIVVDTPPASPLADVGVLTPLVDGVVLVVRAGRTPRPAIDRALEEFDPDHLLGLVLNDVEDPKLENRP